MLKKEAEQRTSSEEILDMLNCRTPGFQAAFHWPDGQTPPAFAHVCLGDFSVSLAQQRQGMYLDPASLEDLETLYANLIHSEKAIHLDWLHERIFRRHPQEVYLLARKMTETRFWRVGKEKWGQCSQEGFMGKFHGARKA